jgi:hypothetical protein
MTIYASTVDFSSMPCIVALHDEARELIGKAIESHIENFPSADNE